MLILLCILFTTLMTAFFKEAESRKISLHWAIPINYLVCALIGFAIEPESPISLLQNGIDFLFTIFFAGILFTCNFFLLGWNTRNSGLASSGVLSKMSMVIPITFSAIFYAEAFTFFHVLSLAMAIVAVFLIHFQTKKKGTNLFHLSLSGILLFVCTGTTDSLFKFVGMEFPQVTGWSFSVLCFSTAFLISIPFTVVKKIKPKKEDIMGGIFLGFFNFFALVCFLGALKLYSGPFLFPVNHTGVLVFSSLIAVGFYKEKLSLINYAGLLLATISILILLFAEI